jgi:superfamily I DNA/RNA helicase
VIIPDLYLALSEIDERLHVKSQIQELINTGTKLQDIAIIVRSNKEVETFSEFLKQDDIPVSSKLDSNILDSDYIKSIFTFFKLLENPYADET